MVPPYVDARLHLDYVYTARSEGATNNSGTLFEGIGRWHEVKKMQTLEDAKRRALGGRLARLGRKTQLKQLGILFGQDRADITATIPFFGGASKG